MLEVLEARIAPATLLFAKQLANESTARPLVATDAAGNIFVVGQATPTVDVDLGPGRLDLTTADAAGDVYYAKYDPNGVLVWGQTWGGGGGEFPRSLVVDANGDLFVAGHFNATNAGFNGVAGTLSSTGDNDVFVFKVSGATGVAVTAFDGDGQLKWGGTLRDNNNSMALDGAGHLLLAGVFNSADAGFNATGVLAAVGPADGYVLRVDATTGAPDAGFDTDGMRTIGGADNESVRAVDVDSSNNVFVGVSNVTTGAFDLRKLTAGTGALDAGFGGGAGIVALDPADTGNNLFALTVDPGDRVVVASKTPSSNGLGLLLLKRYFGSDGTVDPAFSPFTSKPSPGSIALLTDSQSSIYVSGVLAAASDRLNYVARFGSDGVLDPTFGLKLYGHPHDPGPTQFESGMALDPNNNLILRGNYATGADLDPTGGTLKIPPRADVVASPSIIEGFLVKVDPAGIDAKNPLTFRDGSGETINVSLRGAGSAHYQLVGGVVNNANLNTLELFNTNLSTAVSITHAKPLLLDTTVNRIFTHDPNQHVGSITLGSSVLLGDGVADAVVDLRVTGKLNALTLDGLNANAFIKLGEGLPYNVPNDTTTPDTYNNRPEVFINAIFGGGVTIEVIGDGTVGGIGGGGLGNVTIGAWVGDGVIRTTQSIGDFTVQTGNFLGALEVDKFHVGSGTRADAGRVSIPQGAYGSNGSEIEGYVEAFDANAFLANATITAASIGSVSITKTAFDGTIILTDPDAPALAAFNVASDFTGNVQSASPIKKLKIKGDFTGSLSAPAIGSIAAYSFLGQATPDPMGGPDHLNTIEAYQGSLGTLTTTAGVVRNFEITASASFKGFNVKLARLTDDTFGIDNVRVQAASIGNISVNLAAAAKTTGVDLIGIRDSEFVTTGTASEKSKTGIGNIGKLSVTLTGAGAASDAVGIQNSTFDALVSAGEFGANPASTANPLGNISVKLAGHGGANIGLEDATFAANSIGTVKVVVNRGKNGAGTARAVQVASFTSSGAIGAMTFDGDATVAQVEALEVWAGANVGPLTVKAKTPAQGSLSNSDLFAGQSLALNGATEKDVLAALARATMGGVKVSGSITGSQLVAGGSMGSMSVGGDLSGSLLLAGATFGGDFMMDGDESYHRAASIGDISVKGALMHTSVAAGIDPGNGDFGDADDALAAVAGVLASASSKVGAISLALGNAPLTATTATHHFAIEAAALTALKVNGVAAPTIPPSLFLDQGTAGEDADDIVVRTIV